MLPATTRRVSEHTSQEINERIARQTEAMVARYASASLDEIDGRLAQLDREWDIERLLEANASAITLLGLLLAISVNWLWLLLPIVVASFLFLHALQGWCPPVPLLRRLGVRTQGEIEMERYSLKALRGDFEGLAKTGDSMERAKEAIQAAKR